MAAPGQWTSIGPTRINDGGLGAIGRIHSIAIDPAMPATIYAGAPRAGLWKTTNGGGAWAPVADGLPTLAVAAVATDPSAPGRVYLVLEGDAIYRSDDGAGSWQRIAGDLGSRAGFGKLLVDPRTPSTLYVIAEGNGVYRSTDSGANWTQVKTGTVNDLVMDPTNPAVLYAALQGDGVYKTTTGGAAGNAAWTKMGGLPTSGFSRVTLAISAAAPRTIYAGLSGSPFQLYRSTNATSFALRYAASSGIYNPWLGVDPGNAAIVYVLSADFLRSTDGGTTFAAATNDLHECQGFAADPVTPGVIYLGRDSGLFRSADRGVTFAQIGSGIANVEFYDGAVAATAPKLMLGGTQDNGTIKYDGTSPTWKRIQGGDGATVAFDPTNAQILYGMGQYAESITRSSDGGGNFSPFAAGLPGGTVCFNLQFLVHPGIPTTLVACCGSLWRITSPSGSWSSIFAPPNQNIWRAAIEASADLYYAASTSGRVWAGPSGSSWQQVFAHPASSSVSALIVDPDQPSALYAAFAAGAAGRIYRLVRSSPQPTSLAATDITANLPVGLTVNTIAVDRAAPFSVFVGTNLGIYRGVSPDGADWRWAAYNDGLPLVAVNDLEVHPVTGVMRAATFGRSAYEVDTEWPIGSVISASGRITFLRVHDAGTGWGPASDSLEVEVVALLDSRPGRGFGFQLRADGEEPARKGMLDLLRTAFVRDRPITIDYVRTGLRNGRIIRVADQP